MKCLFKLSSIIVFTLIFSLNSAKSQTNDPILKIHYLGHSAFVLQFDNGITVVTDYGKPNAWLQWGWDSPIHSINDLVPDVMTYSHTNHEDHYDPSRMPDEVNYILTESDTLLIDSLSIMPIRVCEQNLNNPDNSAFLFEYKGLKILHLGDAQIEIKNIGEETIRERIHSKIPKNLDLLFMTIDGRSPIYSEAALFVDLVRPRRVIPMHHWTEECRENFIAECCSLRSESCSYDTEIIDGSVYSLFSTDNIEPVRIICLERSEFPSTTPVNESMEKFLNFRLEQNYPNPFNPSTIIEYSIPVDKRRATTRQNVKLYVYDTLGIEVAELVDEDKLPGNYTVEFDAEGLSSGIYFFKLIAGRFSQTKKMILVH